MQVRQTLSIRLFAYSLPIPYPVTIPAVRTLGIIPARYGSKRFPGKPLAEIRGKTMIQRVWEQASLAKLDHLVIATDDDRIYEHAADFGVVVMTSPDHASGTDRCAEAAERVDPHGQYDVVLNIQGDQPFIDPEYIDRLVRTVAEPNVDVATLCCRLSSSRDLLDPAIVKVVVSINGTALYFSRSPVPYVQGHEPGEWTARFAFQKHIGTYAFKRRILSALSVLTTTPLEEAEQLEQLRWLEHGYTINLVDVPADILSVDRPEDILR